MPSAKSNKPIVHLFIPHLLQNLPLWKKDFMFEPECQYLPQLLRQNTVEKNSQIKGLNHSLFASIEGFNSEELPVAYYRHQAHLGAHNKKHLVCSDPVHLEVGLNDITLTEAIVDLSDEEAGELIALLNQHFKQDNLAFILGSNSQWYLVLPQSEIINTIPLENVLRQNIAKSLPVSGERNWQVIQNEIQMLLHSSKVNQQREMMGKTSVNSLWLWGGGIPDLERNFENNIGQVAGGNIDGKTIASALCCEWKPLSDSLPNDFLSALKNENANNSNSLIILDQLIKPAIYDQHDLFQQALTKIDQDIIKPLMTLWQSNQIELIIDSCDGRQFYPVHAPSWKFWLKEISLLSLAQNQEKGGRCT